MNKKPIELHLIDGTKSEVPNLAVLPDTIKKRIPVAEWIDNPDIWDKKTFIKETAEFLHEVYGIGSDQDKTTLAMLADQLDTYIQSYRLLATDNLVVETNNGKTLAPNPLISIKNNALKLSIQLMNELGLTPKSRLSANKTEDNSPVAQFLKGAFAQ
jgi:phage terminase small subunit